jgi:hypothetical protein
MTTSIKSRPFSRFLREESGVLLAETVIILPILIWAFLGLYVYWDAYRSVTTVQKAAYTISDMISREMNSIDNDYITGLDDVMEYLVDEDQDVATRVTSVAWSVDNQRFEVHWSRSDGPELSPLTTGSLQPLASQIPEMAEGDFAVIVEVRVPYSAAFDVGLTTDYLSEFIVTRPRFLRCIVLDNGICPIV